MASWSYLRSYRSLWEASCKKKAAKKSEAETSKGARLQARARCSMTFSKNSCGMSSRRSASAHDYRLGMASAWSSALWVLLIGRVVRQRIIVVQLAAEFLPVLFAFFAL